MAFIQAYQHPESYQCKKILQVRTVSMNQSQQSRQSVLDQIQQACEHVQRDPASVQLLAVFKDSSSQSLREMYQAGQRCFGENYLQEALTKIDELQDLEIEWHFIGHVQRNKTRHWRKSLIGCMAWIADYC